jgi:hypothetical protein
LDVEEVMVWPDNWQALTVFNALGTQWRVGMAGPTGLDYGVLPDVFRFHAIPEADWPDLFQSIRAMEGEALAVMHEKE